MFDLKSLSRSKGLINMLGLIATLVVIFGIFQYLTIRTNHGTFVNLGNIETILRQSTVVCLAALGMTLVIVSGGIDLSVGSVVAFATVGIAWTMQRGHPPALALGAGILAGLICGFFNGLVVAKLKVGPFIVTLATMLIARGLAKGLANEQKIDAPTTWVNDLLSVLGKEDRWRIFPWGVWVFILLAFLTHFVLTSTRFGKHVVATGSNEQAARLCGVPVDRVKLAVYVVMGLFAGIAGIMSFSRLTVGDPTTSQGLELSVIAAVVIGGASLAGGQGTVAGSVLGALIMATISSGCSQLGLANWIQEIITGMIIVASVTLDRMRLRRNV